MIRVSPWSKNGRSKPTGLTCEYFSDYGEPTKIEDCTSSEAQMCDKSEIFSWRNYESCLQRSNSVTRIMFCGESMVEKWTQ